MILLAVSGGPDSMFLLNDYKKEKILLLLMLIIKKEMIQTLIKK